MTYESKNSTDWFNSRWNTIEDKIHQLKGQSKGPQLKHREKKDWGKKNKIKISDVGLCELP